MMGTRGGWKKIPREGEAKEFFNHIPEGGGKLRGREKKRGERRTKIEGDAPGPSPRKGKKQKTGSDKKKKKKKRPGAPNKKKAWSSERMEGKKPGEGLGFRGTSSKTSESVKAQGQEKKEREKRNETLPNLFAPGKTKNRGQMPTRMTVEKKKKQKAILPCQRKMPSQKERNQKALAYSLLLLLFFMKSPRTRRGFSPLILAGGERGEKNGQTGATPLSFPCPIPRKGGT